MSTCNDGAQVRLVIAIKEQVQREWHTTTTTTTTTRNHNDDDNNNSTIQELWTRRPGEARRARPSRRAAVLTCNK